MNTELFNHVDSDNIGVPANKMKPPFNLPAEVPKTAPMNGLVNDYINTLQGMSDPCVKPFLYDISFAKSMEDFYKDLKSNKLPQYAFIEPKFMGQHNDQHPSSKQDETCPGTVLLGEKLIYEVYNAIKNSEQYRDKTLFIITQDEHGR